MTSASIIIPVFNRAHLVSRAIESALEQTHPCEVVLVDHGSTDHIADIVDAFGDRIRYVRRDDDRGPVAAWRHGIEASTGKYVHFTFDDDWIAPGFMERCISEFDDDTGFVYTRVNLHHLERGKIEPSVLHPPGKRSMEPLVRHLLRRPFALSPGCAVFRRDDAMECLLEQVPGALGEFGPGAGVGEDLLLFLLISLRYPSYVHIDERLADFLAHQGSITIGAMQSGRGSALAEAYGHAKRYYANQPGALSPDPPTRSYLAAGQWLLESGATRDYGRKLLRRLRR